MKLDTEIIWCRISEEFAEVWFRENEAPVCFWPAPFSYTGGNTCCRPGENFIKLSLCELRKVIHQG